MMTDAVQPDINVILADIASSVVGSFEIKTLLNQIITSTMKFLNAEVCSIFLENKEREPGILRCVAGSGFAEKIVDVAKYEIGEGFTGTVAQVGEEYNIKSLKDLKELKISGVQVWEGKCDEIQWPSGENEFRNLIVVPLRIKDQILGVMKVENKVIEYGDCFTDDDLRTLKTIANVIALTIENARLHKHSEEQLKSIAAKAAHRINNQVASYEGMELDLNDEANSAVPNKENLADLATRLSNTTKNLKKLINEFKNYGKPTILEKELSDIHRIIQDEIWLSKPPLTIEIGLRQDPKVPYLSLDTARFSESIKELLINSIRAIQESRGTGNIQLSTKVQEGTDKKKGKSVLVLIDDDGPGFPPGFPVFTPFGSTDPQRTGLGLATVKELVEAHGGSITLKQKEESGACFEIQIPIK